MKSAPRGCFRASAHWLENPPVRSQLLACPSCRCRLTIVRRPRQPKRCAKFKALNAHSVRAASVSLCCLETLVHTDSGLVDSTPLGLPGGQPRHAPQPCSRSWAFAILWHCTANSFAATASFKALSKRTESVRSEAWIWDTAAATRASAAECRLQSSARCSQSGKSSPAPTAPSAHEKSIIVTNRVSARSLAVCRIFLTSVTVRSRGVSDRTRHHGLDWRAPHGVVRLQSESTGGWQAAAAGRRPPVRRTCRRTARMSFGLFR